MQIQKVIENLGFSAKEAKVYLAVLHLGESRISDIAVKVKLPRSSAQIIMDNLRKEGLVNFYVMRRYKYWVAENPERLLKNLKKREEVVVEALPELIAIRKENWGKGAKLIDDNVLMGNFRLLADGSEQPVLIANEKAEIQYVNEPWEQQFGYSLQEVQGQNPRMLQSGKTPRSVYEGMWKALKAGKMFQSDEIIDKRKDGTVFHLLTTIFPLKQKGRLFYIQILDDITERKRVEGLQKKFTQAAVS
jgi:PAS domain S-box-containing protein